MYYALRINFFHWISNILQLFLSFKGEEVFPGNMVILQCIFLFKWKGMYLPRHFSGNCYIYELSTQYCSTSEISLRACGNTIKDHKDDVHRLRQLLGKNGASVLYTQTLPSFTIIPFCCRDIHTTIYIRYTFSSNHSIHKISHGFCFWASDPLIDRF